MLVHGEVTDPAVDLFDREAVFIDRVLIPLRRDFPELKVVFEHLTTKEGAHYVQGADELAIICGALIGAGLGFLWFNAPPAMIFMGDTGSLALGGALGAIAVATKHEIVLAIVGGLFVLETLSVIIQVASFKLTGKRVFRMAPLHHHYEQKGWKESTVVVRFWIISVVLALVGLATLKLR